MNNINLSLSCLSMWKVGGDTVLERLLIPIRYDCSQFTLKQIFLSFIVHGPSEPAKESTLGWLKIKVQYSQKKNISNNNTCLRRTFDITKYTPCFRKRNVSYWKLTLKFAWKYSPKIEWCQNSFKRWSVTFRTNRILTNSCVILAVMKMHGIIFSY